MRGKKLQSSVFRVFHADDVLIVKKAIEVSQTANTAVIGDDTDLLVFLLYHARNIKSFDIFFHQEPKQFARKKPITVSTHSAVRKHGMELCENILFIHALLGCDTISSVLGIGEGASLKAYNQSRHFREQAHVFAKSSVIIETMSEQITSIGEKALLHLYKGTDDDNLDSLRYRMFRQKVASSRFHIKPEVLPSTSAAAKYHSFRVFHQVRLWKGENLSATEWGWEIKNEQMEPTKTGLGCELLSPIRCNCKAGCSTLRCSCRKHGLVCNPACEECRDYTKLLKLTWSSNR